jgi:hypothetical protein
MKSWLYYLPAPLLVAAAASGATLTVDDDGPADFTSIQAAIAAAANGDLILVRPGTYAEALSFGGKLVTLRGDGGAAEVVLSSPDGARMLHVQAGESNQLRFERLTFTGGTSEYLVQVTNGSPVFEECIFRDNVRGAFVDGQPCGSAVGSSFERCLFLANRNPNGGAVYMSNSNCRFEDCEFIANQAVGPTSGVNAGGAVYVNDWNCGTHTFRFTRCIFANNSAVWGGAIYSQGIFPGMTTQMPVNQCIFVANTATQGRAMWNWYITVPLAGSWFCGGPDQIRHSWTDAGGNTLDGNCAAPPYADCDGDRISDAMEISAGLAFDCDGDSLPDACAIASGSAADANGNGVPDPCETPDGTLTVDDDGPADFATIQAAIDAATHGMTIEVAPGTYGPFDVGDKRLAVRSASGAAVTTIDAAGQPTSAVKFGAGSTFDSKLQGFTIRTGRGTVFPNNPSGWRAGGGVYLWGPTDGGAAAAVTIEDCVFIGSSGGCGYGAGLWTRRGNVAVRRCVFQGLSAQHHGPAISVDSLGMPRTGGKEGDSTVIEDCFIGTSSSYNNGGILIGAGATATPADIRISRCEFVGNSGTYQAGALLTGADPAGVAGSTMLVERCVFVGNTAPQSRAIGIGILGGHPSYAVTVQDCVVTESGVGIRLGTGVLSLGDNVVCSGTGGIAGAWTNLGGNLWTCPAPQDCDGNGVEDLYDTILGRVADDDGDRIPDSCQCPGDVIVDGQVDAIDLAAILFCWDTACKLHPRADCDGDGVVTSDDLAVVLAAWGPCP